MQRVLVWICALAGVVSFGSAAGAQSKTFTPADIDKTLRAEWKKESITPAPLTDDARFLRRVSLDITGTIPSAEAVRKFLADRSPAKRWELIEDLLNSPGYVEHWTNYWDEVLMGRQQRPIQLVDRTAFRQWLSAQFKENTAYNKFVYELITASGQNSTGGSYLKAAGINAPRMEQRMADEKMANEKQTETDKAAEAARINGAVNFTLKYAQALPDLSGAVSKTFLGVQIQCAQCHDHKTEKWKQDDFRSFTACFTQTRPVPIDTGQVKGMRRVELRDVNRPFFRGRRMGNNEYTNAAPAALDGTDFASSPNRRQALAAWITAPENPYFADAIVNRMWAYFTGRGFVDPIDDFRPTNPATMPALMKSLSADFVASGYDLKHLIRTICNSQVYQLASSTPAPTPPASPVTKKYSGHSAKKSASAAQSVEPAPKHTTEIALWSRSRLKPMGPEELFDSLIAATNLKAIENRLPGGSLEGMKNIAIRQLSFLFDVDEEFEQKDFEGTIPQALLLLNGGMVNNGAMPLPGTTLAEVLAMPGDDGAKIEELYLRTLSRKPTATERAKWIAFVNAPRTVVTEDAPAPAPPAQRRFQAGEIKKGDFKNARRGGALDPFARLGGRPAAQTAQTQAYEDLFWALLNSSEFIFNH